MSSISVLVVEDNPRFRQSFVDAVRADPGLSLVGAAANGAEGMALLLEHKPDVVLVDLDLPDFSGVQIIRRASRDLPDTDVMVITVFGDERSIIESIEAGATGYLLKDALPPDFVGQIHALRAGGSPISPVIARRLLGRFQPPGTPVPVTGSEGRPELSEREHAVLSLVAKGFTFGEISGVLSVSPHTVTTHVKRIYRKLQVGSKTEAVYEARKLGLLRGD